MKQILRRSSDGQTGASVGYPSQQPGNTVVQHVGTVEKPVIFRVNVGVLPRKARQKVRVRARKVEKEKAKAAKALLVVPQPRW